MSILVGNMSIYAPVDTRDRLLFGSLLLMFYLLWTHGLLEVTTLSLCQIWGLLTHSGLFLFVHVRKMLVMLSSCFVRGIWMCGMRYLLLTPQVPSPTFGASVKSRRHLEAWLFLCRCLACFYWWDFIHCPGYNSVRLISYLFIHYFC